MTAHYLPIDLPPSREQRVERLQERLADARLAVVTAKTSERLQEVAHEIDAIASLWNQEEHQ